MAYLDYSSLNDVGEPCVIVARFNDVGYQIEETIAEDFGEFILQLVKEQLADYLSVCQLHIGSTCPELL